MSGVNGGYENDCGRSRDSPGHKRTAEEAGIHNERNQVKKPRNQSSRGGSVVHPVQAAVTEHFQSQNYVDQFADMTQLAAANHKQRQPDSEQAQSEQRTNLNTNASMAQQPVPGALSGETVPGLNLIAPFGMQSPNTAVVSDKWEKASTVEEPPKNDYECRPFEVQYKKVDHSSKPVAELGQTQKDIQEFLYTMDPKELLRLCAQLCVEDTELFQILKTSEPQRNSVAGGERFIQNDPEPCKIFIRGLNLHTTTADTLREVFKAHGTVVNVSVVRDKITGVSKGYGFITMSTPEEAKEALKTPQRKIDGSVTHINHVGERRSPRYSFNPGYAQFAGGW